MPITLPDLEDIRCLSIQACGIVKTKSKKTLEVLRNNDHALFFNYEAKSGPHTVVAIFGGGVNNKSNHFHIDVWRSPAFRIDPQDRQHVEVGNSQLQANFNALLGRRIEVKLFGLFEVPVEDIPKSSLAAPLTPVKASKTKRDRLPPAIARRIDYEIPDALVRNVSCRSSRDGKIVEATLATSLRGVIGQDYLQTFTGFLLTAFNVNILGEVLPNGPVSSSKES